MKRGCYQMAAGRHATVDGSVLVARSCDSFGGDDLLQILSVPRKKHDSGSTIEIPGANGVKIPQIPQTNAYIAIMEVTEGKDIAGAQGGINEYQVSAGASSGGVFNKKAEEVCPKMPTSIGDYRMTLVLERCKTAREGIELIGMFTEKYGARFDNYIVADPQEAWLYEEYQGNLWAAVRIPDDCFIVEANTFRIDFVNFEDPSNFMGAKNLVDFAMDHDLYDPSSNEPFSPAKAFCNRSDRAEHGNRRRIWRGISLLAPSINLDPEAPSWTYPLFIKATQKLTPKDLIAVFCDYYSGTKYSHYDMHVGDYKPKTSPIIADDPTQTAQESPLHLNELRQYQPAPAWGPERIVGTPKAITTWAAQLRSWLPNPIGGLLYGGIGEGATVPHMPFYVGITRTPKPFQIGSRQVTVEENPLAMNIYDEKSAYWIFRVVTNLVNLFYTATKNLVIPIWRRWEEDLYKLQPAIEKVALELYELDPDLAIKFLTSYSNTKAIEALEMAKDITVELHSVISYYNA